MATIRDNIVLLKCDELTSLEIVSGSLKVTKGQPSDPKITFVLEKGIATIRVRAGRKKSKEVAEEFIKRSGGHGHMKATYLGRAGSPDELNYCFTVRATFDNDTKEDLQLAQGSTVGRNNHWIGGKSIEDGSEAYLETGNLKLRIEGTSLEKHTGQKFKGIIESCPPQIQPVLSFLGKLADGAFFSTVNTFTLTKV